VARLLAQGHPADQQDEGGTTPLHLAVRTSVDAWRHAAELVDQRLAVAKVLIDAGANPNACGPGGRTALHVCAAGGTRELAELLVGAGANPRLRAGGDTPLVTAAKSGRAGIVEFLLALPGSLGPLTWLPLHRAAVLGSSHEVARLAEWPRLRERRGLGGWTALHLAGALGRAANVRVLLEAGCSPGARNRDGQTPLLLACAGGHAATVGLMVRGGADPSDAVHRSRPSTSEPTPFGVAWLGGHTATVAVLLRAGVDPDGPWVDGCAPLSAVLPGMPIDMVRLVLEAGGHPNPGEASHPLQTAWVADDVALAELLLLHGSDPIAAHVPTSRSDPARPRPGDRVVALVERYLEGRGTEDV
jgi:uncharacterized protein